MVTTDHRSIQVPEELVRTIISDAERWLSIAADPQRLTQIQKWLLLNGINPDDVSPGGPVSIEQHRYGGSRIRYHCILRTAGGRAFYETDGAAAAVEERSVALYFNPPAELLPGRGAPGPMPAPTQTILPSNLSGGATASVAAEQ